MSFLQGLHGTVAGVLICSLLIVDEAGLPLPIAPNEVLLLLMGVLIASGAFPLWLVFPAAFVCMAAGMVAGYAWARTVGRSGLHRLAERVHAAEAYARAQERLQSARPLGIGVSRMIPGLRPYATLVSGAAEVDLRTFLLGALPALLLWEILWVVAGILVGLPLVRLLGRFERAAMRGATLLALTAVAWLAVRDASNRRGGVARIAPRLRASLALLVDAAIVLGLVGGLTSIGRRVAQVAISDWIELAAAAVLLLILLVAGRSIQTPGEALFDTQYWHHSKGAPGERSSQKA